jgi:hypothetical protein
MTLIRRYKKRTEPEALSRDAGKGGDEQLDQLRNDIKQDEVAFRGSIMFEVFVDARLRGTSKAALKETRDNLAYLELLITNEKELFKILAPFVAFFYFFFHIRSLLANSEQDRIQNYENVWTMMMWSILKLLRVLGVLRLVFLSGAWIRNCFMNWEMIANAKVKKQNSVVVVDSLELDAGLGFDCIDKYYEKTDEDILVSARI